MSLQARIILASVSGGIVGVMYFFVLHPWLTGLSEGFIILGRPSAIALFTRGIIIILFMVILATATAIPSSLSEYFLLAFINAFACLVPIPLIQYLIKAPKTYGEPRFSLVIIGNGAIGLGYLLIASFVIAGVACLLLSLLVGPILKWIGK